MKKIAGFFAVAVLALLSAGCCTLLYGHEIGFGAPGWAPAAGPPPPPGAPPPPPPPGGAPPRSPNGAPAPGQWVRHRFECHVLGNILLLGPFFPLGYLIDLENGTHMERGYAPGGHLPDGDPQKLLAAHLSDGTVAILKDVHEPTPKEIKKARHLPQGVSVVKTEWVMRKSGS